MRLMPRFALLLAPVLAVMLALAAPVAAQDDAAAPIQGTITSQMQAFQRQDAEGAFQFASPSIQQMFRTPGNFAAMVQQGYPMVWQPRSFRFGELREIGGDLWQKVLVQDAEGRLHALDYRMVQVDGQWRIGGVQFLREPDLSV